MRRTNAFKFTRDFVREGIQYLKSNAIPDRYHYPSRKYEFQTRYAGMRIGENNQLFLGDLKVIEIEEVKTTLAELYKKTGDIGRDRFYALVKKTYAGISRRQARLSQQSRDPPACAAPQETTCQ